jgi:predicted metal-binding membrane protein
MSDGFEHLGTSARTVAKLSGETRMLVLCSVWAAVGVAWLMLLWTAASLPSTTTGPGGWLVDALPFPEAGGLVAAFAQLCLSPETASGSVPRAAALVLMWFLMAVATMLPSAAPMIRTYCEIADTASAAGKRVVHPWVLVAGYLVVWLAAAIAFAALTIAVQVATPEDPRLAGWVGAAALALAGGWQFSTLKDACLTKCRAPFSTLFGRWSNRAVGVFRLGMEQGLWCLGCCWALMLVMFAVGIMNIFWMALIGLFAMVEKTGNGRVIGRIAGTILLVWAATLLVIST